METITARMLRAIDKLGLENIDCDITCTLRVIEEFSKKSIASDLFEEFVALYDRLEGGEVVEAGMIGDIMNRIASDVNIGFCDYRVENVGELRSYLEKLDMRGFGLMIERSEDHIIGVRRASESGYEIYGLLTGGDEKLPKNLGDKDILGLINMRNKGDPNITLLWKKS